MIDNSKIGICKQCAFKNTHCIEREESNKNNLLVTYACEEFRGKNNPLRCDIEKCGAPAKNYVDDHGVDTILCEDHYKQWLRTEEKLKRVYCEPCDRTSPECDNCNRSELSGNSRQLNSSEIPNSSEASK